MNKKNIGVGFIAHLSSMDKKVLAGLKLSDPHFLIFGEDNKEEEINKAIVSYSDLTSNIKTSSNYLVIKVLFDQKKIFVDLISNFASMKSKMLFQIPDKAGEISFDREFESYVYLLIAGKGKDLSFYDPRDQEIAKEESGFDMAKLRPMQWLS